MAFRRKASKRTASKRSAPSSRRARRGPPTAPALPEQVGLAAAIYTDRVLVWSDGEERVCTLRGKFKRETAPVVGDRVRFLVNPDGTGTIVALEERTTTLIRRAAEGGAGTRAPRAQVLAANVEQQVIVAALREPPFRPGLVERFLVAGAVAGLTPLICLTKLDLDRGGEFDRVAAPYRKLGISLVGTSVQEPATLRPLARALAGKTSVLVGHSGVGKTSLLNALVQQEMAVRSTGGKVGRGRHTTSTARLIPLLEGGFAIDSPGVREFGLHGITPAELATHYPEFRPYLNGCGFRDCLHRTEPRCAVREAVESGDLTPARYEAYLTLLEELE